MAIEFHRAERKRAKLRLAIAGPSGSGKTYSALLIASGIVPLDKVAMIDTESGSADLYAELGQYNTCTLQPPYSPQKYIEAIHAAEQEGFELIIIDSLSHAWTGEGGLLDQQGKAAAAKYRGNDWAAWREITPQHNALVEAMLHSKCHVIATMRSKTAYEQTKDERGKSHIEKLGLAPVQRAGIEYEFTTVFDLSQEHVASVSKDRTRLFDGKYFIPTAACGQALLNWLNAAPEAGNQEQTQAPGWAQAQPGQNMPQGSGPVADSPMQAPPLQAPPLQGAAYGQPVGPTDKPLPQTAGWSGPEANLRYIWQQTGWETEHPLIPYMTQRIQAARGADKTIADAIEQDWEAVEKETCAYLQSLPDPAMKQLAASTGAPVGPNGVPF